MEDVESRALHLFSSPSRFCCTMRTNLVEDFHRHLNSIEPSIQFTFETETECQLAFLGVMITRNPNQSINMTVYRKLTHTNKYLKFSSHHPLAHKIAVVWTLHSRAQALTSTPVARSQKEQTISQALIQDGYPTSFFNVTPTHYKINFHPLKHQPPLPTPPYPTSPYPTSEAPQKLLDGSFPH